MEMKFCFWFLTAWTTVFVNSSSITMRRIRRTRNERRLAALSPDLFAYDITVYNRINWGIIREIFIVIYIVVGNLILFDFKSFIVLDNKICIFDYQI